MALYLEKIEKEYLKKLLTNNPTTWWPHKKILEKIEDDDERRRDIKACSHVFGEYKGKKHCCTKCGCYGVGMGLSWTLKKELSKLKIRTLKNRN